jgi:hypothetical protein
MESHTSGQIHKSLKERAYIDNFIKWECLSIFIDRIWKEIVQAQPHSRPGHEIHHMQEDFHCVLMDRG